MRCRVVEALRLRGAALGHTSPTIWQPAKALRIAKTVGLGSVALPDDLRRLTKWTKRANHGT